MSLLKRTGTGIGDVTWDSTVLATKESVDGVKKTADLAKSTADSAKGVADAALPKAGGTMTGAINMNDKQVKNVGTPTDVNDAVTKKYVDDALSGVQPVGDYVSKSGDTMTGNLNMGNHQINNVDTMTVSNVIVKGAADSQVSIKTTGDASRSEIDLNDASDNPVVIKGVDTPADDTDAANKSYVDSVDAKVTAANAEIIGVKNTIDGITDGTLDLPYLPLSGGTMTGSIDVNRLRIKNVGEIQFVGIEDGEAALMGFSTDATNYILTIANNDNKQNVIKGISTPTGAGNNIAATKAYVDGFNDVLAWINDYKAMIKVIAGE